MAHNLSGESAPERRHSILKHLGLASQPPSPDEWLRIASYRIDGPDVTSAAAAALVQQLDQIGITTQETPYKLPDYTGFNAMGGGPEIADRIRIAVLVQRRDFEQARKFVLARTHPANVEPDPVTRAEMEYEKLHPEESQSS